MLVHGSAAERTRGLDLAADDALSLPLDPAEFLSRIRSQLRSKEIAEDAYSKMKRNSSRRPRHQRSSPLTSFRHVMKVEWIHICRSLHGKRQRSTTSTMTLISLSAAWTRAWF